MAAEGPASSGRIPDGRTFELGRDPVEFGEERIDLIDADGARRSVNLHDYATVYDTPGLYEAVVQEALRCRSPEVTAVRAAAALDGLGLRAAETRVLDIGAGNGVVGEHLAAHGFQRIFGTDLLAEAERATRRDRPAVYERYLAGDLTDPDDPLQAAIVSWRPQLITCAGALGGGHMSAIALTRAFAALTEPAIAVLTVAEERLDADEDGLGAFLADSSLRELGRERFRHRFTMAGDPVHYLALTYRAPR